MTSFWFQQVNGVKQQHSPQLHKQHQLQPFSPTSSSPKHGHSKMISIRALGYGLIGGMALLFLASIIALMLWDHGVNPSQGTTSTATIRRRLFTPFDGAVNLLIKQQIRSFLRHPTALQQMDPSLQNWDWPLVHIVNTRFMQEQGHLKALATARLHLFRTFCLPTMIHQSNQQFLWIIKTDPNLEPTILQDLIQDLQPYPNVYLVASNLNFMVRDHHQPEHSWRDGAEIQDLLVSTIYTGDPTRLYQAMLQKDRQVVLETRLDADDGLHRFYLQKIQEKALNQFGILPPPEEGGEDQYVPPKWLYWCTRRHVEWHGGVQLTRRHDIDGTLASEEQSSADYYGSLLVVEHSKLCITPGITVGFGIGTPSDQVPLHAHDKLFKAIRALSPRASCGYSKVGDCLEFVEDFLVAAIRARTPTSAGMQRVMGTDDEESKTNNINGTHHHANRQHPPPPSPLKLYMYWDILHDAFFLNREQIQYTNRFILNHLVAIAQDNLQGQCTSEHSCKKETKEKLLRIIEENKK